VDKVSEIIQKSKVTSYTLISKLEELGILKEISGAKRDKLYMYKAYLDLFKNN
jgi:hypothetical protein